MDTVFDDQESNTRTYQDLALFFRGFTRHFRSRFKYNCRHPHPISPLPGATRHHWPTRRWRERQDAGNLADIFSRQPEYQRTGIGATPNDHLFGLALTQHKVQCRLQIRICVAVTRIRAVRQAVDSSIRLTVEITTRALIPGNCAITGVVEPIRQRRIFRAPIRTALVKQKYQWRGRVQATVVSFAIDRYAIDSPRRYGFLWRFSNIGFRICRAPDDHPERNIEY